MNQRASKSKTRISVSVSASPALMHALRSIPSPYIMDKTKSRLAAFFDEDDDDDDGAAPPVRQ